MRKIPKIMHTIWVWPLPPPMKRLEWWKNTHLDREWKIWWNEELKNNKWINQKAIDYYSWKWLWNWVADCMRYEILFKHWWVLVWADWECLNNIDELFEDWEEAYQIDTSHYNEETKKEATRWCAMPLFACVPWFLWARKLIQLISRLNTYKQPSRSTGNWLMQKLNINYRYKIKTFPIHYFIPVHFNWWRYTWPDKVYSIHHWGSTRWTYIDDKDNLKF